MALDLGSAYGQIKFLYDPKSVARAKGDLADLGKAGTNLGEQFRKVGTAMTGIGGAISGAVGLATNKAADFESRISNIASVGGAEAVKRMDEIRASALKMGADTSFSATEAADAIEELIKSGLNVDQVIDPMNGATRAALDLSAATGFEVVKSAELMATAMNVFGDSMQANGIDPMEQATYVADLFSQTANASAADMDDLALAFQQVANVADLFGISVDNTAESLAILSNNGLKGSDAGTSLKQMLLSLTNQTKPAKAALKEIGLTFDDFYDSAGNFIGIEPMFEIFRQSMEENGKTADDVQRIFAQLFGSDAIRAAKVFFDTSDQGWADVRAGMDKAGSAQDQAKIRLDNLKGAMEALQGSIETAMIAFGTPLLGGIKKTTQGLTEMVNKFNSLDTGTQAFIAKLVAGLGTMLGVVGSVLIGVGYFHKFASAIGLSTQMVNRLTLSLGVVGALIAAFGVAYAINFLGFRDAVNAALGEVTEFADVFGKAFSTRQAKGVGLVKSALGALGKSLKKVFGIDIEDQLNGIGNAVEHLGDLFNTAVANGASPFEAALRVIGLAAAQLGLDGVQVAIVGFIVKAKELYDIFTNVFDLFSEAGDGGGGNGITATLEATRAVLEDLTGMDFGWLSDLADKAKFLAGYFRTATNEGMNPFSAAVQAVAKTIQFFTGLDIIGFMDKLGTAVQGAGQNYQNLYGALKDVAGAFLGGFESGASKAIEKLGELKDNILPALQGLFYNIGETIKKVDLGTIKANVGDWLLTQTTDLGTWIKTNIVDKLGEIDIDQLKANVGSWLISEGTTLLGAIDDIVQEAKNMLGQSGAGVSVGNLFAQIQAWSVSENPGSGLGDKINQIIDNTKTFYQNNVAPLGTFLASILGWIVTQGKPLWDRILEIVASAKDNFANKVQDLGIFAAEILGWAVSQRETLWAAVQKKVEEVKQTASTGAQQLGTIAVEIAGWLVTAKEQLWTKITSLVTDAKTLLDQHKPDLGTITATISGWGVEILEGAISLGDTIAGWLGQNPVPPITVSMTGMTPTMTESSKESFSASVGTLAFSVANNTTVTGTTINLEGAKVGTISSEPGQGPFDRLREWIETEVSKFQEWMTHSLDFTTILDIATLGNRIGTAYREFFEGIIGGILNGGAQAGEAQKTLLTIENLVNGIKTIATAVALPFAAFLAFSTGFIAAMLGWKNIDFAETARNIEEGWTQFKNAITLPADEFNPDDWWLVGLPLQLLRSAYAFITDMKKVAELVGQGIGSLDDVINDLHDHFFGKPQTTMYQPGGQAQSSFGETIITAFKTMLDDLGTGILKAITDWKPPDIKGAFTQKLQEVWDQITSFDFGGLRATGADAAELPDNGEKAVDPKKLGESFGKMFAKQVEDPQFVNGISESIKQIPQNAFRSIGSLMLAKIGDSIHFALQEPSANQGAVDSVVGAGIGKQIMTQFVGDLANSIENVDVSRFQTIGGKFIEKVQTALRDAISGSGGQISGSGNMTGSGGFGQEVVTTLTDSAVGANYQPLSDAFKNGIIPALVNLGTEMKTTLTGIITAAISDGTTTAQTAISIGETILNQSIAGVGTTSGQLSGSGDLTGGSSLSTTVSSMVDSAVTTGVTIAARAIEIGTTLLNQAISGVGSGAGGQLSGSGDVTGSGGFAGAVIGMVNTGINAGVNAATTGAPRIGKAISDGAATGVVATAMDDAVRGMVSSGIEAGMKEAEAHSPSERAARELGEPIGQGGAEGVDRTSGEFSAAIQRMIDNGVKTGQDGLVDMNWYGKLKKKMEDISLSDAFKITQDTGKETFFNAWMDSHDEFFDNLYKEYGDKAAGLMEHFYMVLSQGEAHSDVLSQFSGKMKEAMIAVGEDMSDGVFSGWDTFNQQFGEKVIGKLRAAYTVVMGDLGLLGKDVNSVIGHLGSQAGDEYATGVEGAVKNSAPKTKKALDSFNNTISGSSSQIQQSLGDRIEETVHRALGLSTDAVSDRVKEIENRRQGWMNQAHKTLQDRDYMVSEMQRNQTIVTNGKVVMDGREFGDWVVQTTLGNLGRVENRGGRRASRLAGA